MILGAEIGMLFVGIMALTKGKLILSKKRVVMAPLSRRLAVICLLPNPLAYIATGFVHFHFVRRGWSVGNNSFFWTVTAVEGAIVLGCMALVYGIGWTNAIDPTAPKENSESEPQPHGSYLPFPATSPPISTKDSGGPNAAPGPDPAEKEYPTCPGCGHWINLQKDQRWPPWCPRCGRNLQLASASAPGRFSVPTGNLGR
jgi:hypothetical protein